MEGSPSERTVADFRKFVQFLKSCWYPISLSYFSFNLSLLRVSTRFKVAFILEHVLDKNLDVHAVRMQDAGRLLPSLLQRAGESPEALGIILDCPAGRLSLRFYAPPSYHPPSALLLQQRCTTSAVHHADWHLASFRVTVQALGRFCGNKGWRIKRISARTGAKYVCRLVRAGLERGCRIFFQEVKDGEKTGEISRRGHLLDVSIKAESLRAVKEAQQLFQQEVMLDSIRDSISVEALSEILRRECFLHKSPLIETDYNTAMNMMVAMKMFDSTRLWLEYVINHERDVRLGGLPFKTLIKCAVEVGRHLEFSE
eukprot:755875-Hanusia_phi.AAC.3